MIPIVGEVDHPIPRGFSYRMVKRRVGLCECGHKVELREFTNTCVCGRDYSMNGSLLAPRSQWGEETGETASDILSIGHHQEVDDA